MRYASIRPSGMVQSCRPEGSPAGGQSQWTGGGSGDTRLWPAPKIVEAVRDADAFLNLNELEFSETNFAGLIDAGFLPEDLGCAALGSEDVAKEHIFKRRPQECTTVPLASRMQCS